MTETTDTEVDPTLDEDSVPRLADGVALCGEYQGSGYAQPRYLISRSDEQMVLVSALLYRVTEQIDGSRPLREVAERVNLYAGTDVTAEDVAFLVGHKLHPLGLATLSEDLADPPRSNPLLSLALHRVLVPGPVVRALARVFAPLFWPPVIVALLGTLLAVDVWLVASGGIDLAFHRSAGDPVLIMSLMLLWVVSTVFHEFGHAAGCQYGGARPGAIGVGMLTFYPCFYTNVTDAYRLDRRGRLRTDLGGVYFNAVFIVATAGLYELTHLPVLIVFMVLNHVQAVQQLLPLLRMDGYYILGDLVGVPNLFAFVGPVLRRLRGDRDATRGLDPRVRRLVTGWVLVIVPVLVTALVLLLIRLPFYLATGTAQALHYARSAVAAVGEGHPLTVIFGAVSVLVLMLPWLGATAFLIRLGRRITKLVTKFRERRAQARQSASPETPDTEKSDTEQADAEVRR